MQTLLTIAGFDPSSGAGVTADLAVMSAHGFFGTSCITALTVQSTLGVAAVHPVGAAVVARTLDFLVADLPPAGIKVGMLGSVEVAQEVAAFLRGWAGKVPIVLDPVVRSSSGRDLLGAGGVEVIREQLLPVVDWVTPNVEELCLIAGNKMDTGWSVVEAAQAIRRSNSRLNVVVTGGNLDPPDDLVLEGSVEPRWVRGTRIASSSTHGTGCAFSSALLCHLVLGETALRSVEGAKEYVRRGIERAEPLGGGQGPLNLLWTLRKSSVT